MNAAFAGAQSGFATERRTRLAAGPCPTAGQQVTMPGQGRSSDSSRPAATHQSERRSGVRTEDFVDQSLFDEILQCFLRERWRYEIVPLAARAGDL